MNINVDVGNLYAYSDHYLRVIFVKDNQVMLEKWTERELRGYVVVTSPSMDGEKLAWLHSEQFYCRKYYPLNATPTEAFEKAMRCMRGTVYVHALIATTKQGTRVTLYSNRQLAMKALQKELDANEVIQSIVETSGMEHLTAEAYLLGILSDTLLPIDSYKIHIYAVNNSIEP